MRRAQSLTGADLAGLVGMSQPKISRLERGRGLPDPDDVATIARALGADDPLVQRLRRRAAGVHDRRTDWRPAVSGLANRQEWLAEWEGAAGAICDFEPVVLAGLMQTSGYARAVLTAFERLVQSADGGFAETAVLASVTARIGRQEVLADPGKSFRFVFTESALRSGICSPIEMLGQIDHLRFLATRPNVELAILPDEPPSPLPPLHGFTLFDEGAVVIDVFTTGLVSRNRVDVERYRRVFDLFTSVASMEIGPILDRCAEFHIDQLRGRS